MFIYIKIVSCNTKLGKIYVLVSAQNNLEYSRKFLAFVAYRKGNLGD